MGFLKFLVWTGCAVGLGVFLANADINSRSTLEYVQRQWKHYVQPAKVDRQVERMKDGLHDAIDEAKGAVNRTTKQTPAAPRERITNEDRAAIDRIIAQKK